MIRLPQRLTSQRGTRLRAGITIAAWLVLAPTVVTAERNPVSVDEAIANLQAHFERQGYRAELVIDHAAAADSVRLELPPTQVLFLSNPRLETGLMRRARTAGLDLPIRCLAYEGGDGDVRTGCSEVGFLIDRHDLFVFDPVLFRANRLLAPLGGNDGIEIVESERDFDSTLEALLEDLEDRGFRIPSVIDYAERARSIRRRLGPTTLVMFGNPAVGTPLMQSSRGVAIDLPQKMLIFEDADGQVSLAYNDPFFLASKHDVIGEDTRLGNIARALESIARSAGGVGL